MRSAKPVKKGPGRPPKLGEHKVVTTRLPVDLVRTLRHLAVDRDESLNDVVVAGLRQYIATVKVGRRDRS